jgi:hypothetical protein
VRTQQEREEQSVLIGTALGVFARVLVAEALGLWLLHAAFDLGADDAVLGWLVVGAATVAITTLVRSDRR